MIVKLNHEILNKYRRQVNNHIFILFLAISLMFLSCSKNSEVNEMQQNLESAGETEKYNVYIMSTNGGGNIIISSQGDRFFWNTQTSAWTIWNYAQGSQGVVSESDLNQVFEINSKAGTLKDDNYIGKFAGAFNPGTKLNINITVDEGFSFKGWTGYKCIKCYWVMTPFASNESSMELTVDKFIFLTANFEKIP